MARSTRKGLVIGTGVFPHKGGSTTVKYENLASDTKFFPGHLPNNATTERLLNHPEKLLPQNTNVIYTFLQAT